MTAASSEPLKFGSESKGLAWNYAAISAFCTLQSVFLATVAPEKLAQRGQCSAYHGSWWAPSHRLLSSPSPYLFLSVPSARYTPEVFPDGSIGEAGADRQRGGGLPKEELRVVEMASDGVVRYGAVRRRRLGKCTVVKSHRRTACAEEFAVPDPLFVYFFFPRWSLGYLCGFFFFLHRKKGLRPKLNPGSLGTSSATPSFPSFLFSVPPRADVSKRLIHHAPLSVVRQTNRSDTP